jgi:hypothetical protein
MGMSIPDAAAFFKRTYFRLLFPYEQKYYFGKELETESMDIIPEKKRKLINPNEEYVCCSERQPTGDGVTY